MDTISCQRMHAESDPEKLFVLGCRFLQQQLPSKAHRAFAQAYKLRPDHQRYRSYYGLTVALVERDLNAAIDLCSTAMKKNYFYPDLYRNLGRVYLLAGQRQKAHGVFMAGLRLDGSNGGLIAEVEKMGIRKPPVFPFLDRKHPLNYYAGKFRCWFTRSFRRKTAHSSQSLSMVSP